MMRKTGIWTIPNLPTGDNTELTIDVSADALGQITNICEVTSASTADPDSTPDNNEPAEDDYSSVIVTVSAPSADLELTKDADNLSPTQGEMVAFTLTLTNQGPDQATDIQVTDALPEGLTFVSQEGGYDSVEGIWSVASLDAGGSALLTITVSADGVGEIVNVAEVSAATEDDPDSIPGNQNPDEDDYSSVTVNIVEPTGACCLLTDCVEDTASACGTGGGNYLGDATLCADVDCSLSACCFNNGFVRRCQHRNRLR